MDNTMQVAGYQAPKELDIVTIEDVSRPNYARPMWFAFKPQPDITAYELAVIIPILFTRSGAQLEAEIKANPGIARHFKEATDG